MEGLQINEVTRMWKEAVKV